MADYTQVKDALKVGANPREICMTCPWDRFCVTPPAMTAGEVDGKIEEAKLSAEADVKTARAEGREYGMGSLVATMVTTMLYAGKDTQADMCPVFALRLRSSEGRVLVDVVRDRMKSWDDNKVTAG